MAICFTFSLFKYIFHSPEGSFNPSKHMQITIIVSHHLDSSSSCFEKVSSYPNYAHVAVSVTGCARVTRTEQNIQRLSGALGHISSPALWIHGLHEYKSRVNGLTFRRNIYFGKRVFTQEWRGISGVKFPKLLPPWSAHLVDPLSAPESDPAESE